MAFLNVFYGACVYDSRILFKFVMKLRDRRVTLKLKIP